MPLLARLAFAAVDFAARKGLAESAPEETPDAVPGSVTGTTADVSAKQRARRTGIRGETYAYWYLRRHGYILVARNYTLSGMKGEIDMVGYDGQTLAFVEVKTRSTILTDRNETSLTVQPLPEQAVNWEKRRNLKRIAQQFLRARHVEPGACRFDVLAIQANVGAPPSVRLHKGAFHFGNG